MKKSISIYIFYITLFILPSYIFSQISEILWENYYDNNKQYDIFKSVKQTTDSSFLCIGNTVGLWLVKIDKNGNTIWEQNYVPPESSTGGKDILEVNKNYYCLGTYYDDSLYGDVILIV